MKRIHFASPTGLWPRASIACALVLLAVGGMAEEEFSFNDDILPIVETYCFGCHNPNDKKGELDLMRFETDEMVLDSIALWERIAKRLDNREMPPKKSLQPTKEEKETIAKWAASLELDESDCNRLANEESMGWFPGYVMSRRLNRIEYENTVRDLLGIEIPLVHLFPADGSGGEGFDNNGSALFLSAIQIEKYLQAADLAVETALPPRMRGALGALGRFASRAASLRMSKTDDEKQQDEIRETLISVRPSRHLEARRAARGVVKRFAERAWRRPVQLEEIDRLLGLFDRCRERGDDYDESIKLAFKGVLVSPHFLFLAEPEPDQGGVRLLDDFPLASRLSYFLWASMPDEELFGLARHGLLHDEEMLRFQVRRMLADPKSRALGDVFAAQWLEIVQLGKTKKPDADRFPEFDDQLADSMREEAALFFHRIVGEDRSLLELIDADYTFANERLAAIYGLDDVKGEEMMLVQLADPNRGGVLGMAAVLTATSHPLRTSPVLRGKWVLGQLLGDRIPPPPPNVEQLPDDVEQAGGPTLRERMEAHRSRAECATCHVRMDPIGFGLENFDPIGRWRDRQAGQPIDATGVLPSGETFDGPAELKGILLQRKDDFVKNLSRKMLGYALGRSLNRFDTCVVAESVKALQENDYRASHLFERIVLSYPFRHRYSGR